MENDQHVYRKPCFSIDKLCFSKKKIMFFRPCTLSFSVVSYLLEELAASLINYSFSNYCTLGLPHQRLRADDNENFLDFDLR